MALGSGQRSGARSCGKLGEAHLRPGSCVCKTGVRTGPHPARGADRERRVREARGGQAGVRPGARGCGPGHELRVWPLFRQSEIISEHAVGPKRDGKGGFAPLRLRAMRPGPNLGGIRGHPGAGRTWRPAAGPSGKPARGERAPQGAERWHSRGSRASLSPAPGSAPNLPRSVLLASLIL